MTAQAVALPVVAFSTAGYVHYGSVDFVLGMVQVITNEGSDSIKNFLPCREVYRRTAEKTS
ncbi:MAG TPA: hypothetical protein VNA27_02350 [Rubrobacteraceae bacterium]|nr:hypothetical protein [Rubrobacteraceae bacterium]